MWRVVCGDTVRFRLWIRNWIRWEFALQPKNLRRVMWVDPDVSR